MPESMDSNCFHFIFHHGSGLGCQIVMNDAYLLRLNSETVSCGDEPMLLSRSKADHPTSLRSRVQIMFDPNNSVNRLTPDVIIWLSLNARVEELIYRDK